MKSNPQRHAGVEERRRHTRRAPGQLINVSRVLPVLPVSDAEVINTSAEGVAIRTRVPLKAGGRLSFSMGSGMPPVLAEVLAVDPLEGGYFRVRCRCLLGGFEG